MTLRFIHLKFVDLLVFPSHGGTENGGNFGANLTENDSESFQFISNFR